MLCVSYVFVRLHVCKECVHITCIYVLQYLFCIRREPKVMYSRIIKVKALQFSSLSRSLSLTLFLYTVFLFLSSSEPTYKMCATATTFVCDDRCVTHTKVSAAAVCACVQETKRCLQINKYNTKQQ